MKHVFIINPIAGKGVSAGKPSRVPEFTTQIETYFAQHPGAGEYHIRLTEYPMHATEIVREECEATQEEIRIYGLGGDGTLNEMVAAAHEYPHCAIGIYPCGTGNDFVKSTYPGRGLDVTIEQLIEGKAHPIDLIKCNDRYSVNICSLGFDADVNAYVSEHKEHHKSVKWAYNMAVVDTYLHKFGVYCDVDVDGEDGEHHFAGDMMFCLAANGAYYGGSYYPAPKSYLDDGLLDFIVIDKVNRLFFLELVVQYTKGTYIKHEDIVHYHKGRRMTVRTRAPLGGNFDGEIFRIGTETTFEVVPGALRFIFVTDEHGDIMGARLKPQA